MRCSANGWREWPPEELQTLARYMAKLNATYERDGFPRDEPHAAPPAPAAARDTSKDPRHTAGVFLSSSEWRASALRKGGPWPTRR